MPGRPVYLPVVRDAAVAAVIEKSMAYQQAADAYKVNRHTLRGWVPNVRAN